MKYGPRQRSQGDVRHEETQPSSSAVSKPGLRASGDDFADVDGHISRSERTHIPEAKAPSTSPAVCSREAIQETLPPLWGNFDCSSDDMRLLVSHRKSQTRRFEPHKNPESKAFVSASHPSDEASATTSTSRDQEIGLCIPDVIESLEILALANRRRKSQEKCLEGCPLQKLRRCQRKELGRDR